jgi:hypothetical protein
MHTRTDGQSACNQQRKICRIIQKTRYTQASQQGSARSSHWVPKRHMDVHSATSQGCGCDWEASEVIHMCVCVCVCVCVYLCVCVIPVTRSTKKARGRTQRYVPRLWMWLRSLWGDTYVYVCMCMCVCDVFVNGEIHTYVNTYIDTYMHTYIQTDTFSNKPEEYEVRGNTYIHTCMHAYIQTDTFSSRPRNTRRSGKGRAN